jgi:hypothetical protein
MSTLTALRPLAFVAILAVGCGASATPATTTGPPATEAPAVEATTTTLATTTTTAAPTTTEAPTTTAAPAPPPPPPTAAPAPPPPPAPAEPYYANCAAAKAAGAAPIRKGQPGYRSALDRDGDGTACDK